MKPYDPNARQDQTQADIAQTATALSTSEVVNRFGSANAEYIKGFTGIDNEVGVTLSKGLKGISTEGTGIKQRAGWAGEVASTSRDNAEAIISKSTERTIRSDDLKHYGIQTDSKYREAVDRVKVNANGDIVYEAQTKLEANGNRVANQVSHEDHKYKKYFGKKLELPSEQVDDARAYCRKRAAGLRERADKLELNDQKDLAEKFRERADKFDQLEREDIVDLGITTEQAIDYVKNPKGETLKDIGRTSHRAGIEGAKIGAVVGGSISLMTNLFSVALEQKQLGTAVQDLAIDTAQAAALGYGTAFVGAAIKGSLQQSGNQTLRTLSNTNAPAMIVDICLSLGGSIKRYVNDEISEAQLLHEVGEKGAGMLSSGMMAALGQVAIPIPFVGAAIGGMIGYTLSSMFYKVALEAAEGVEHSRIHLARAQAIEAAARQSIADEQTRLDAFVRRELPQLEQATQQLFSTAGIASNHIDTMAAAINQYAGLLGQQLQFQSIAEFDDFMDSDSPLTL
ncbi:hypothetical protein [Pseudomonas canadensis]|uniref:hypothetical protein n=1 Tax=Pseudomonas canadensis TaxID=915099 RepID=UPI0030D9C6B4